jgi:hypothetical protein
MSYELPSPSSNHAPDSLPVPTPRTIDLEPGLSSPEARLDPRLTDLADTAVAAATITERASLPLPTDSQPAPNLHEVPQPVDVQAPPTPAATDLAPSNSFSLQPTPVVRPEAVSQEAAKPTTLNSDAGTSPSPSSPNQSPDHLATPTPPAGTSTASHEQGPSPEPRLDPHATEPAKVAPTDRAPSLQPTQVAAPATIAARPPLTPRPAPERQQTDNHQPDEPKVPAPDRPSTNKTSELATPPPSRDKEPVDQPILQTGGAGHGNKDNDPTGLRNGDGEERPQEPKTRIDVMREAYERRMEELKEREVAERMREVSECLGTLAKVTYGPYGKDLTLGLAPHLRRTIDRYNKEIAFANDVDFDGPLVVNEDGAFVFINGDDLDVRTVPGYFKPVSVDRDMVIGRRADIPFEIQDQPAVAEIVVYDEKIAAVLTKIRAHGNQTSGYGEDVTIPAVISTFDVTVGNDAQKSIGGAETYIDIERSALGAYGLLMDDLSIQFQATVLPTTGVHANRLGLILDELGVEDLDIPKPGEARLRGIYRENLDSEQVKVVNDFLKKHILPVKPAPEA